MENLIQVTSVPIIVTLVYGALAGYKTLANGNEKLIKIIPIIAAILGVILGITAFYAVPEIIAADNILTAILIGGSSGLAATGTNQIFKQLVKPTTPTTNATTPEEDKKDDTISNGK